MWESERGIVFMRPIYTDFIEKTDRIDRLKTALFARLPAVESARALLLTESYKTTESEPLILRRAKAFAHILENIPIIIRDDELVVGSATLAPRGCQTFPEFSFDWLEAEFDTIETRSCDPFSISEQVKEELRGVHTYWKGKTTSELAQSYMAPESYAAFEHGMFTPGNYFYNGVGHITVDYAKVLKIGYRGIADEARAAISALSVADGDYAARRAFLDAVVISCGAAVRYAKRYAALALEMARSAAGARKDELLKIAANCNTVPENGAQSFYEACQSFWFVQMLLQMESSGHSISPGRFDVYMYPYYKEDMKSGTLSREFAQELIDCLWIKLNDLNKARDAASAEGFAGYSLFQNLIAGGQDKDGRDITSDLSYMCINATLHVMLPQPSFSVRVWNGSPHRFLIRAAELTRTGVGLPAYYNDEVIIPSLQSRGLSLSDAREYNIIGCVEPQKAGKTDGWHDAAFFNMCRPLEMVFSRGVDKGVQLGVKTPALESFLTFCDFADAYKTQMNYFIELLVNADNAIDTAHKERCPLPFESSMVEDCIGRGKSVQEGGAVYNFTGPQGFGVANMADALYAVKTLVFEQKAFTLIELKDALDRNFGQDIADAQAEKLTKDVLRELLSRGQPVTDTDVQSVYAMVKSNPAPQADKERYAAILEKIEALPKFGNDNEEIDSFAREIAYLYTRPLEKYKNPRGGSYQAGLYPVSANVPLGAQTGATPDGRLAFTPVADGVSPAAGRDINGPTAAANSVARLDHFIASNGTLFNMKFHPTALAGQKGLENFVALVRGYFDQKGSHMQFNVVSRETLRDAQKHPENYKSLVVRVAGYSALFTTLSRSLQEDIISRTEQGSLL